MKTKKFAANAAVAAPSKRVPKYLVTELIDQLDFIKGETKANRNQTPINLEIQFAIISSLIQAPTVSVELMIAIIQSTTNMKIPRHKSALKHLRKFFIMSINLLKMLDLIIKPT
ncbi:hypothetical protein [Neisseria mucosa]|uniref:hypothetical protein n=1 Tax=Neisseria mucosa TaxID=488 RepID=UPI001878C693|nr:hypothetical protein [Neisseria mucosa]